MSLTDPSGFFLIHYTVLVLSSGTYCIMKLVEKVLVAATADLNCPATL
jgi:hypothetical protein